ncbi:hypothetical protein M8A51_11820 [Schlegelella sp. S2-27]|uniref:Uncharacterized protein n=1 Tax=Caldimonas mangrovi TaxID=2944811 RepID=A0ABT0YP99_9BURK|nr:hypothetical protein [Caldimonas mangrovi]MCM5680219.1 hypothetical protein [Caldimonas mangrovi]
MQTVRLLDPTDRAPPIPGPARVGGELSLSSLGTALLGLGRAVVLRGDDQWPEQVTQIVQAAREQLPLDQQHHVIDALVKDAAQKAPSDRALGQCRQLAPRLPEPYGAHLLAASPQTWVHQYPAGSLYERASADLLREIRECRVAFEGLRNQAAGAEGAANNGVQSFKAQAKLDLMSRLGIANVPPVPDLPLRFKSAAAATNRPDDT